MGIFSFGKKKNQTKKNNNASAAKLANNTRKRNNLARRNAAIRAMNRAALSENQQALYNHYMNMNQARKNVQEGEQLYKQALDELDTHLLRFRDPVMFNKQIIRGNSRTYPYKDFLSDSQMYMRQDVYALLDRLRGIGMNTPDLRQREAEFEKSAKTAQKAIKEALLKAKAGILKQRNTALQIQRNAQGAQISEGLNNEIMRKLMNNAAKLSP